MSDRVVLRPVPWSHLHGGLFYLGAIEVAGVAYAAEHQPGFVYYLSALATGLIGGGIVVWLGRRVEIGPDRVRLHEFRRAPVELPRARVAGVERAGSLWRVFDADGGEFWLSSGWTAGRVHRLVRELNLPEPVRIGTGEVEAVLRDWGSAVVAAVFATLLMGIVELVRWLAAGDRLWVAPLFAGALTAIMFVLAYAQRIVVGRDAVRVRVETVGLVLIRRSTIREVVRVGGYGYLRDDRDRWHDIGKWDEDVLRRLATVLDVPLGESKTVTGTRTS